jgi:hypothetical protein
MAQEAVMVEAMKPHSSSFNAMALPMKRKSEIN